MFSRNLVPLDMSKQSEEILPRVRRLADPERTEILLLHVVHHLASSPDSMSSVLPQLTQESEEYLTKLEKQLSSEGLRARRLSAIGPPGLMILDHAQKEDASLIAMTTHGRSGLSRWIFGSVAEKVLRAPPLLVLVAREPENGGKEASV